MDTKTAVAALTGLGQQSRLEVFRLLVERGPLGATPGEIIERLGIPASTLSFHLKELHHAELIHTEQLGRYIRYRADLVVMRDLVDFLTQNCCAGNPGLCEPLCGPSCGPSCAPKASSKPGAAKPAKKKAVPAAKSRPAVAKTARRARR